MSNYKTRMINGMKCISEEEFCESEEEFCEQFICTFGAKKKSLALLQQRTRLRHK